MLFRGSIDLTKAKYNPNFNKFSNRVNPKEKKLIKFFTELKAHNEYSAFIAELGKIELSRKNKIYGKSQADQHRINIEKKRNEIKILEKEIENEMYMVDLFENPDKFFNLSSILTTPIKYLLLHFVHLL